MSSFLKPDSKLFASFHKATVLTPNQRLAATLLKKYNLQQSAEGKMAWPTPKLLPLSTWIGLLWKNHCAQEMNSPYYLLNSNQELILWESILRETPENEQLLKLSELAEQASSAWRTLKKWRVSYQHPAFDFTENSRAFQRWAGKYAERCRDNQWLDAESLTDLVIEKVRTREIVLPPELLLLNFTEITPQQAAFFDAAKEQGSQIDFQHLSQSTEDKAEVLALPDDHLEIQTMARWAKQKLLENPEASIGCIAGALEEKREYILSVFQDLFTGPESYNISAGKVLTAYPIVQHAFQLLNLPSQKLNHEILSALLSSTFLGDAENEFKQRLRLDGKLRRANITTITWSDLLSAKYMESCPKLAERLKSFLKARQAEPALEKMSYWMRHFSQLLEGLGWPGEQSLNSAEYQVVQSFMDLLKECALLDNLLPILPASLALHYLTLLSAKAYFQPESPDAPIQILGQLEGAGLPFDYLWVTGLDDTAWPPLPSPNPLLPHDLQKRLGMPNASAERQLDYSLKLTQQFKQAVGSVIFSYALHKEQEELRPSPLIAKNQARLVEELALAPLISSLQQIFNSRALEIFQDEKALALQVEGKLRGGASLFELQAACPFKAFARLRLLAYPLDKAEAGLPPRYRGSVVHRILELLWAELKDQQNLLNKDPASLKQLLDECMRSALAHSAPFLAPQSLYSALVRERLEKLVLSWLEVEKARPPFSIAALEYEKTIIMNELSFSLRVDRIDRLANGEELIIDYKTRKDCKLDDWYGERLTEPQLPLYCLSQKEAAAGIAYAKLHASKTELNGLSSSDLAIAGIETLTEKSKADAPSWAGQLEIWRQHLRALFEAFQEGQAQIDPKNSQTCLSCDLESLCRVYETETATPENSHE